MQPTGFTGHGSLEQKCEGGNIFAVLGLMLPLSEFDIGGVLYHGNYFHLYERGREAWLRACGIPYESLVKGGWHLVVTASRQSFLKPLSYGHSVDLFLWISTLRRASITIEYAVRHSISYTTSGSEDCSLLVTVPAFYNEADIIHRASTTHAFVGKTDGGWKAERFTEKMTGIFRDYYVFEKNS